jgi:hypothetical protein
VWWKSLPLNSRGSPVSFKRIGKAVAKIELRRVAAAFAEIAIRLARDTCLYFADRFDFDLRGREQFVEATARNRIATGVDDRSCFEEACGRHPACRRSDRFRKNRRFGFVAQNCDQGRCIDDHRGNPSAP